MKTRLREFLFNYNAPGHDGPSKARLQVGKLLAGKPTPRNVNRYATHVYTGSFSMHRRGVAVPAK
jgi:hypothetical protein